jgi:hypothetical protein
VRLVTYTLRYNRMHWIEVQRLGQHWQRAEVRASFMANEGSLTLTTENVERLKVDFAPGKSPFDVTKPVKVIVDGRVLSSEAAIRTTSDRALRFTLEKEEGAWRVTADDDGADSLAKRPGLQGPIDDAFMDSFLFVRPTGEGLHPQVDAWVKAEFDRAVEHWRRHFRGEVRIKDDSQVTDDDHRSANLVLWGDPSSNRVLGEVLAKLPVKWDKETVAVGDARVDSRDHALIAIYPNPKNPLRYVVLNSSFTFRDYAYLNNARQVAKLPDWAIVDVRTPPDSLWPGKVVDADFFDEHWQYQVSPEREQARQK